MSRRPSVTALVAGAAALVLVAAAVLGYIASDFYRTATSTQEVSWAHAERIRLLDDAEGSLFAEISALISAAVLNEPEHLDRLGELHDAFGASIGRLSELVPAGDPLEASVESILAGDAESEPVVTHAIELNRSSGPDAAVSYAFQSGLPGKMTVLLGTMEQAITQETTLARESQATANTAHRNLFYALIAVGVLSLAMIFTLIGALWKLFSAPLQRVSAAARAMAAGDDARRAPVGRIREMAELAQSVNTLRDELTRRSNEVEAYLSRDLEARTHELEATNRDLIREVGERERAEEARRLSEMQLRLAMEAADIGTWEWDLLSGAISWSESLESIFEAPMPGVSRNVSSLAAVLHPEDRAAFASALTGAIRSGGRFQLETRYISPRDGRSRWLRVAGEVIQNAAGRPVRAFGTVMNITADRERSEALVRSEESLRAAQRLTGLGSFDWNIRDDTITWSEGMFTLLALTPAEIEPSYALFMSLVHPADLEAFEASIARAFAGESNAPLDCRIIRGDGQVRFVQAVVHVDFNGSDEPVRMIGTVLDVTGSREAEESLRQQRDLVAAVVASAPIVLYSTDANGIFTVSQGLGLASLGAEPGEAVGQSIFDIYKDVPAILDATRRALAGESLSYVADFGDALFDVAQVPLIEDGKVQGMVGVAVDTSERTRLQRQLLQAQKMESVGRLAGGIAHDFNNLLSAIIGYSELASAGLEPDAPAREDIQEAISAANKAAALTRQLLSFARRQIVDPVDVDVNELVANLEKLLRRLIGEDIQFLCKRSAEQLVVRVDPGQFEQVLVNLAVNARDAMPDGGRLTIETSNVMLDDTYAATRPDMQPGSYVLVTVTDSGTGMGPSVLEHIFEPFFTTKEQGKGTGLGLATCYGIVTQAGGNISVYSEPGFGTTFKIYLPRVGAEPVALTAVSAAHEPQAPGSAHILLVEDQPEVRLLIERVLTSHGYTVIAAPNPMKALELASAGAELDLVISDVVMPGMDGVTMIDVLLRMVGPVPVILMSGYAEESVISRAVGRPGIEFVPKPISPETLLNSTREILARWRAGRGDFGDTETALAG